MNPLRSLLSGDETLILPGAHDALSARMIAEAGFPAYGIGGAALSATQLALPDIGIQSFGEYRDAVGRILEASQLPVMVDGENGFGDAKAVTRTVRSFERMGAAAVAFEDLVFPPQLGAPPRVIPTAEMSAKLSAALAARGSSEMLVVGRSDAAYAIDMDEALARAKTYAAIGVDAVLVPGVPDLDGYRRLRDAVTVPIFVVVVPGSPWFAPTIADLKSIGIEAALYPAALLTRVIAAVTEGLGAIRAINGAPPQGFDMASVGRLLRSADWAAID
ncbi:MAG: hypothetical protein JWM38_2222, partial [Sphingomonas bacterium]|nr:hypothetical protein [Sphingomonas bacterium]